MRDFVHLHVHTHYSILDGQATIPRLVDKAIADGMRGMAVTDHGVMFGIKEFFDYVAAKNKKLRKEGLPEFKPIFGCEMYVAHRKKENKSKEMGDNGGYHLIVLAKNEQGYRNLIQLVSRAWTDGYYYRPRTDRSDLERYKDGLIVCSACIAGEVPSKILADDIAAAREAIEWYHSTFGEDYYLEVQRHPVTDPNLRASRDTYPLQQKANKVLIELAHEYGIKLVCTNDSHFVNQEDAEAHDHLLCIATAHNVADTDRLLYTKQEWFKTRAEMERLFGDLPEALDNTAEILDKVEVYSLHHDPIMPFFPIPETFGTEQDVRAKYTEDDLYREFTTDENGLNPLSADEGSKRIEHLGGYDKLYRIKFEADYLARLTYDGAAKRYGTPLNAEVDERIRFELHVMKTMGFPGYFLIVQDFINSARNELGVMVGPGRGSAAGSVVAYCLGITQLDPLKYDLLFERFLNPDRISLPDIDTDFDDDGRGEVLKWVENKYGSDKVAHIITYNRMATKNSIKDVARVEGLPLQEANRLCKAIPDRLPHGKKMNIENAISEIPELKEAEMSQDTQLRNTIHIAKQLEGTVRNTGIHACGTIICRDTISNWVPVSTADDPDNKGQKVLCTQYDGHVIEDTGLIKMDFLGLKTLSEIREAIDNIRKSTGDIIDIDNIPMDDAATYALYQRGATVGTFQFESQGMQSYLRKLRPTVFEDLIAMNALYRPGPMQYIPEFIARKHGEKPIVYDIACMEQVLSDTYGITVYQEQVMLLSRQLGGFTRGESDALRKAMGKKQEHILRELKPKFIEGGKKNGHAPEVLNKIWSDWENFASYAFNKSHAACYSLVAYQTAYLKAHYPAQYMAAVMSRRKDDIKQVSKLMDECRAMGITTYGPDVNESFLRFGVNAKGDIRFGLAAIKGVGESAAKSIIEERERGGAYSDVYDFIRRVNLGNVNRKALENLIWSGAFDSFGIPRETYFGINRKNEMFIDSLISHAQLYQREQQQMQQSLFGMEEDTGIVPPPLPQPPEMGRIEVLKRERELIGMYLSAHPLADYSLVLNYKCNTHCSELKQDTDLHELAKRGDIFFGGIVTQVKEGMTRNNKPYGRVSIEDFDGLGEVALFGNDWLQWKSYLNTGQCVLVKGQIRARAYSQDILNLNIIEVSDLQTMKEQQSFSRLTLTFHETQFEDLQPEALPDTEGMEDDAGQTAEELLPDNSAKTIEDLITVVEENPGNVELCVRILATNGSNSLTMRGNARRVELSQEFIDFLRSHDDIAWSVE